MTNVKRRLKKELGLFDVFAISTGAMFSSGFFLLPGLASHYTGPSVFVAYLVAGLLILPAMFSMAEIATALPRAGGAYFFLDRSLGPLVGTIGGLGTYLALVFKTAFAIIGIGAYAALFWDVPVKLMAVAATMVFMGLNIIGAKKTSGLQNFFIIFNPFFGNFNLDFAFGTKFYTVSNQICNYLIQPPTITFIKITNIFFDFTGDFDIFLICIVGKGNY